MTALTLSSESPDGFIKPSDGELLRQFTTGNDQVAFTELVRRHSGLVFSTALRRSNSPELAQEAAQNVFTALARKAPRLISSGSLTPWLHRAAVLESAALIRREIRYRQAMKRRQEDPTIAASTLPATPDGKLWDSVGPLVDEALNALSTADREVLLLHHGEGRTFREIATRLGLSAEAAQRRGHRALEKLASRLRRRGVTVPALALGGALTTGLTAETDAASTILTSLIAHGKTLSTYAGAETSISPPAWIASPAMLIAAGVISAGLPVWWRAQASASPVPLESTTAAVRDLKHNTPATLPSGPASSANRPAESRLDLLRQALAHLKQTPNDSGPTKLGLQLRKYMLDLPAEELRAVGKLLRGSPRQHREMKAVLEAYSTRLAELEPALALELAMASSGKHPDPDFSNSIDKASLLDVLTRQSLPEFLKAADVDKDFGYDALTSWSAHDPIGAIAYVESRLEGKLQQAGYEKCLPPWLERDPSTALPWLNRRIKEQPELAEQTYAIIPKDLKFGVARQMTVQQATTLVPLLTDSVLQSTLLESIYLTFQEDQPEVFAGLAPFLRLEDDAKPISVSQVVFAWRRKNAAGVSAWVSGLPAGELKMTAERCLKAPHPF